MGITLELPGMEPEQDVVSTESAELVVVGEVIKQEVSETFQRIEKLSPEEQQQVEAFAKKIDLSQSDVILHYGENAQRKLENFADKALQGVVGRDVGEVGKLLAEMSTSIKDFNDKADSNGKILMVFRSLKRKTEILMVKYSEVTETLEKVKKDLTGQRTNLLVDIKMLDKMYKENLDYYKELTMYILAGHKSLEDTRNGELRILQLKAQESGLQEDALLYNDLNDHCESFEKQLFDLELTREICLQTAPQIRLVQKTDEQLARKIQSSITNTIPIWKQKIAIALAIQHNEEAAEVQKGITDLTSQMLEENAKKLHVSMVAAAKESERGIVDVKAVVACNNELLATFDDLWTIREEGCKTRAEARKELQKAEDDLKQKLLNVGRRAQS